MGGTIVTGGQRAEMQGDLKGGNFYEPTVSFSMSTRCGLVAL